MAGKTERRTVRPLRDDDWALIEALFGQRGACGGCWCMEWRRDVSAAEAKAYRGEANREAFRRLVESGTASGVLALDRTGAAVGWCSVGPRASFAGLRRKRALQTRPDVRTWSITCFYVPRSHRRSGVGAALLEGAVRAAFAAGAARVEGYPVRSSSTGKCMPDTFLWTGTEAMFLRAGFQPHPENPRVVVICR